MRRRLIAALVLVTALGACASPERGTGDAPVEAVSEQDFTAPHLINMPNGFMNIAFKCFGPNGIYAHTREAAPVIIVNDPNCEQEPR